MADEVSTKDEGPPHTAEDGVSKATALASKALEILNSGLIVTLPEPSQRSRSYRELILQEMNWMASDYYHERRWKTHAGRQICIGIKESVMDRKTLNKNWLANECSANVKRFWAGIVAKNVDSAVISAELADYCSDVGEKYRNHIHTDTADVASDYYVGERDLIAVTVPVALPKPAMAAATATQTTTKARIKSSDVLDMTLLSMQSMGAEFYSPIFRPPDDDLDMFTMPLMDPIRDDDFNALLVQNFCLKHSEPSSGLSQMKPVAESKVGPVISRKFHRVDNEPSCLAISVRDFDLQVKPKPPYQGELIRTNLTSIDFELLDAWMFADTPSWPMLAICLSYRSSASGLHRFEYSAQYCKDVFNTLKRQPRELVNSSRRLLGPRQRNAITTFLDTPPNKQKFRPTADYTKSDLSREGYNKSMLTQRATRRHTIHGNTSEAGNLKIVKKENQKASLKERFFTFKRNANRESQERMPTRRASHHTTGTVISDQGTRNTPRRSSGEQGELEARLPFYDAPLRDIEKLPVTLLQRKENSNIIGIIKQTLSGQKNVVLQEVEINDAKGEVIAVPQNALVGVAITCGTHVVKKCYRSDRKTNPVLDMPNIPYGEYSNRMSKQLRVGFLGIPAKMFAHSLFYSGRFCKNNRVRRVAVTISNATKVMMPQPNVLYARLFEGDATGIFGRFRHANWQKAGEHSPDPHGELLLKKYIGEVMVSSPSKKAKASTSIDMQVAEILAEYVNLKLSRGEVKQQGVLITDKILLKNVEQVVSNSQPEQIQTRQIMAQQASMQMPMAATGVLQQTMGQSNMLPSAIQSSHLQQQNASVAHPSKTSSPMQMQPITVAMQPSHAQMNPGQMPSNAMMRVSAQQGQMASGAMQSGQITPGSMQSGQITPGSMQSGKITPAMPQSPMQQQQMAGNVPPMHMDQMKRHNAMDIVAQRRTIMPYEQMYHPQVAMPQQYRYRQMPDMNMRRVPMYPMAMYNKQIPYPKAHEDPYRSQHMQR